MINKADLSPPAFICTAYLGGHANVKNDYDVQLCTNE